MTRNETAMAAAFKRAGLSEGTRLHAMIAELLKDAGGGRAKVREALRSRVMQSTELLDALLDCAIAAVAEDMQGKPAYELPGGDFPSHADEASRRPSPTRQQSGGVTGSVGLSQSGQDVDSRPSPDSRAAGAGSGVPKGQDAVSPAREPSADRRKALLASHKSAARAANRQFQWLDGLYEPKNGKPLVGMTYGELRQTVNSARDSTRFRVGQTVRAAHIAVVGRKLMEECDAQGVVPDDAVWNEVLPQETIDRFEQVWTKDKVGKEFIRYLADSDERTLELFLSKPEALPVHG